VLLVSITVLLPYYFYLEVDEIINGEKGSRYLPTGQSDVGGESTSLSLFINYDSHTYSQRVSSRETHSQPNTHYIAICPQVRPMSVGEIIYQVYSSITIATRTVSEPQAERLTVTVSPIHIVSQDYCG
jgi:hypothetical protein